MLWDLMQQLHIKGLEGEVSAARRDAQDYMTNFVRRFDDRFSALALVCEALWELLSEHTELTEDDLKKKVLEIDLRDGVQDGKVDRNVGRGPIEKCPECGAGISRKFNRCLFCGYQSEKAGDPFDSLG